MRRQLSTIVHLEGKDSMFAPSLVKEFKGFFFKASKGRLGFCRV